MESLVHGNQDWFMQLSSGLLGLTSLSFMVYIGWYWFFYLLFILTVQFLCFSTQLWYSSKKHPWLQEYQKHNQELLCYVANQWMESKTKYLFGIASNISAFVRSVFTWCTFKFLLKIYQELPCDRSRWNQNFKAVLRGNNYGHRLIKTFIKKSSNFFFFGSTTNSPNYSERVQPIVQIIGKGFLTHN